MAELARHPEKAIVPVQTGAAPTDARSASVVIVTYNAARHIARCLRALGAQTLTPAEIIVVDNASTDDTAALVEAAGPGVRLIRAGANLGYAGGNNLGAAAARGDYLAFLNPDTEAAPGWLAALVDALEADPTAGLATSKIVLFDRRDRINTVGNTVHYTGLAFCRGLGQPADTFTRVEEVAAVSGAAFLIRRELFARLGGFAADFFMYLEDTDLSWRARLAGSRCLAVPGSVVAHHYATSVGADKSYYLERNRYLLLARNCRPATLLLLLPALLLAEGVTWGYAALRGPGHLVAKLRAWGYVLRHARAIAADARRVQATRRVGDGAIFRQFSHRLAVEQVASGALLAAARTLLDAPFFAWQRAVGALVGR